MPRPDEDHLQKNPGKIINADLLEGEAKFLKGTGEIKDFESEVVDQYLKSDTRERMHFDFVSEELWNFLSQRYGCDHPIKRLYIIDSKSYISQTKVDARFTWIPVYIACADDLYAGRCTSENFTISYVQLSDKKSFSDLKKRIADVVTAQIQKTNQESQRIKPEGIRLW